MTITTVSELRKVIKPLGFTVKTKTNSYGKTVTYVHINSKQELGFNVFTPELLERWKPLFDCLGEIDFKFNEKIYGLRHC